MTKRIAFVKDDKVVAEMESGVVVPFLRPKAKAAPIVRTDDSTLVWQCGECECQEFNLFLSGDIACASCNAPLVLPAKGA